MSGRTTPKKAKRGNVFKQSLRYLTALELDLEDDPTKRRNRFFLRQAAKAARLPSSPRNAERTIRTKQSGHVHV